MFWNDHPATIPDPGPPALQSVNEALRLDASSFAAYKLRGDISASRQEWDNALADYRKVLELYPDFVEGLLASAAVRNQKGDWDGALADLARAMELVPDAAAPYGYRAVTHVGRGDLAAALADVSRGIELEPDSAWFWNMRGTIKRELGQVEESIVDLSHATRLQPGQFDLWLNRAQSRQQVGALDGAIADITHAIEIRPDAAFYIMRGKIKEDKGDLYEALADYERAIRTAPGSGVGYLARGSIRDRLGDFGGALADYEQSLTEPSPHSAYTGFWCSLLRRRLQQETNPGDLAIGLAEANDAWTRAIANFLAGRSNESELLAVTKTEDATTTTNRLCEAFYYVGMVRLLDKDDATGARDMFEQCVKAGVVHFTEHQFAKAELGRLPQ